MKKFGMNANKRVVEFVEKKKRQYCRIAEGENEKKKEKNACNTNESL